MASADWALISDVSSSSSLARGPITAAVLPMVNGGDLFAYGIHSLVSAAGIVALYSGLASFTPMAKAGDVTGALRKDGAGGTLCSCFLMVCLNGQASSNSAYLLGLSDSEPAHIELRKGVIATGLPDIAPGAQGVLRRSSATYAKGTWVHLKLEAISEPGGDVVLNVYQNDLVANSVASPVWAAIPGMASFTDDALQINTGSAPLTSGRVGYGGVTSEINRILAFDEVQTDRQVLP